ncbi:uridylate kinase [Erysipelothrix larvae]|uniref:Uridylate kinase n=1 Tax=Erysipelothrix larvae TaxID=1514105 RepID=A0A0X8GZN6_9FIRM|nr:UMP kinase [Erysipelothrix larvae]AMC93194.1 uridylate kinase [Erysipelothrix larvae]
MYKRVLLKLSGEALASTDGIFDHEVLDDLARQVKTIVDDGVEVAIVVGGGNFIRGKMAEELGIDRMQVDNMGMLGTVINSLAIQGALEKVGVETRVQTAIDMVKVAEPYIPRRAIRHLEKGRVVVFGAGIGSAFFSTDTTAALRASEIKADVILMAKNGVDGVYNADPNIDFSAVKYDSLSYMQVLQEQLKVMDSTATSMCMENDIDLIVFNMNEKDNIIKVTRGETIGTIVSLGG